MVSRGKHLRDRFLLLGLRHGRTSVGGASEYCGHQSQCNGVFSSLSCSHIRITDEPSCRRCGQSCTGGRPKYSEQKVCCCLTVEYANINADMDLSSWNSLRHCICPVSNVSNKLSNSPSLTKLMCTVEQRWNDSPDTRWLVADGRPLVPRVCQHRHICAGRYLCPLARGA